MNPDLTYLYNITKLAVKEVNDIKKTFLNKNKPIKKQKKTKKIPFQKGIPKLNKTRKLR
tara:strand:- start:236 stop:412 length:177 start_codon:yes stop_codon:yes gene_type:complete